MDCVGLPQDHIDFVLENEMDAWAMTDHGNLSGYCHAFLHEQDLKKKGRDFKFIPGVEFYLHPDLAEWRQAKSDAEQVKAIKKKGAAMAVAAGLSLTGDDAVEGTDGVENEAASKTNKWLNPVNKRHHLVVLAKTSRGLKNLFTLVSRSSKEGFYKFPRIDYRMLKEHGEDLIVSTACCAGNLSYDVLSSYPDIAWDDLGPIEAGTARDDEVQAKLKNSLDRLVDAVGQENVFVEIQFNALKPQHLINRHLMKLAKDEGMPLVATADSHYCRPDYWQSREIYKKLGWLNYEKYDPGMIPQSVDELKCELYPKNASQMWDSYRKYCAGFDFYDDQTVCDAIERTHDIAHQLIGDVSPDRAVKLPAFVVPKDRDEHDVLVELCREGMVRLGLDGKPEYEARLEHELGVIKLREAERYFLTMKAIIDIAWEHMIVGPGRGSSAGSLVCYCLNITQIDPLRYGLLFERFLAPARKELPDVDSDFADRDGLVTLLKERFGTDNVIPISNFNTFKLNSLVRDLSRFYGLPHDEVNRMMKQADNEVRKKVLVKGTDKNTYEMTLEQALEHSTVFRDFIEEHPVLGKHINVLLKQNKTIGRHAGGVLISDRILEQMPVISVRGELQSPWSEGVTVKHLHEFGWCKFDLLGLDTLRIIQRTVERILEDQGVVKPTFAQVKAWYDEHLHPSKLDLDDQHVYDYVYGQGNCAGTFQMTSPGAKRLFKQGKPKNVIDIAALTSIFRPGPLAIDADKAYIRAKSDPAAVVYDHPLIEEVLGVTYGLLVFQEQMVKLGAKVGGLSPVDCDRLRKALGKKQASGEDKRLKEVDDLKALFVKGAVERGFTIEKAERLFKDMAYQSGYSFNASCTLDTEVVTVSSEGIECVKRMDEVRPGDMLLSRDEMTGERLTVRAKALHRHGVKQVFEVKLTTGQTVRCSKEHKFRVKETGEMLPLYEIVAQGLSIVLDADTTASSVSGQSVVKLD